MDAFGVEFLVGFFEHGVEFGQGAPTGAAVFEVFLGFGHAGEAGGSQGEDSEDFEGFQQVGGVGGLFDDGAHVDAHAGPYSFLRRGP